MMPLPLSHKIKDTRNNHGIMVNINEHSGITTSKFQMQDLPQDVAKGSG